MDLNDKIIQKRTQSTPEHLTYVGQLFSQGREERDRECARQNALSQEKLIQEMENKREEKRKDVERSQNRKVQVAALLKRDENGELSSEEIDELDASTRMLFNFGRFRRSTPEQRTEYLAGLSNRLYRQ